MPFATTEHFPQSADPAASAERGPIRLLVVEPDPLAAARIVEGLSARPRPSFVVVTEPTADAAGARLSAGALDAVLLALDACDGGLDRIAEFVARFPRTPFVVLTADDDPDVAERVLACGAQDHLPKDGLSADMLARSLRYAICRQEVRNELEHTSDRLREANARLERLALIDPLTDLLNRRGLEQALTREVLFARRDGSDVVVFLLDLDDFKRINDGLGHAAGDRVLRDVGRALRDALRATDYVARVGGDEFLVVLPKTRLPEGLAVAEKVRRGVEGRTVEVEAGSIAVTASVGVVQIERPAATIDALLVQCQDELRASKRGGKNRVTMAERQVAYASAGGEEGVRIQ